MKNSKFKIWHIPIVIAWFIGLFMLFYGSGRSRRRTMYYGSSFRIEYFTAGLIILISVYLIIQYIKTDRKNFSPENFHKEIVISGIKQYKICEDIDLTAAGIESYVFGIGKDQNDYANIFYNRNDIEFVKTKITIPYFNKSLPEIKAFTNIDAVILKEIFQEYSSTKVYFDKYIPTNYYIDLEFLIDSDIQKILKAK